MNIFSALLISTTIFSLSAPAFAATKESYESQSSGEKNANGSHSEKSSTENTNTAGTTTANQKNVDVDVKSDGTVKKTVSTKHSTDPKGLYNKHTTRTKDTETSNTDGTVKATHKKVVDGSTTEKSSTDTTK